MKENCIEKIGIVFVALLMVVGPVVFIQVATAEQNELINAKERK